MNFNEYQAETRRTAPKGTQKENLINYALGLVGEAGEVADSIKKVYYQGHELDKDKIAEEVGDFMWYAARIADELGWDFEEVAKENRRKLRKRYKDGFSEEASRKRVDVNG